MKITYDSEAKAVYIQVLDEKSKHLKSIPQNDGQIYLSYNTGMQITGIEILNVDLEPSVERIG